MHTRADETCVRTNHNTTYVRTRNPKWDTWFDILKSDDRISVMPGDHTLVYSALF